MPLDKVRWTKWFQSKGGAMQYWIGQDSQMPEHPGVCFAVTEKWLFDDVFFRTFNGVLTNEHVRLQDVYKHKLSQFVSNQNAKGILELQNVGSKMDVNAIVRNIHDAGTYKISMFAGKGEGGHVIALRVDAEYAYLFDANAGCVMFDDIEKLKTVVNGWLKVVYKKYGNIYLEFTDQSLWDELNMLAEDSEPQPSCWDCFCSLFRCFRSRGSSESLDESLLEI